MLEFTKEAVAARLSIAPTDPEFKDLDQVVEAVGAMVSKWVGIPTPDLWGRDVVLGAVMLASRLHRRRNSPAGVETFNELGAVYVSRRDPDVAMLLGLGEWTRPEVG